MENLIYILIGIAWVGYSLYSARQKAIQKQQSAGLPQGGPSQSSPLPIPGNQGGGKSLFDDILRELSGETRPVPQVQKPVMPTNPVIPKTVSEMQQSYESRIGSKFISTVPDDSSQNASLVTKKPQQLSSQLKKHGIGNKKFNLRQAVIYSELLNPKYF